MNRKKQKELVARQDYLVDRLTNGEEEFLDMLEEFYDISVILNGLVKKEKKCTK
tara:strand:- start:596 stop:757 length:162 start_codon:yes stop_codon:yes gene_type:complete